MALRDTSFINSNNPKVVSDDRQREWIQSFTHGTDSAGGDIVVPLNPVVAVHKVIVAEWVALTYAAAVSYANSHAADTNTSFAIVETNRLVGAYKLVRTVDSLGSFS